MTTRRLAGNPGLAVPDDFDVAAHDAVAQATATFSETHSNVWHSFASAWNGIPHRFLGAHAANDEFVKAMALGDGPPPDERHHQERAIFVFTVSALSAIECSCFAINCLGVLTGHSAFPLASAKDLVFYPDVRDRFAKAFGVDTITGTLNTVLVAPEFVTLGEIRNVLTHRGALPRSFFLSVGGPPSGKSGAFVPTNPKSQIADWRFEQQINPALTNDFRVWLGPAVATLIRGASRFVNDHLL